MAARPARRRFSVAEYHRMGEAGILAEDDRVELLDGEIVEMTPIGPRHASCVDNLNRLLVLGLGDRAVVRPQNPSTLDDFSEPQPDLCLARPKTGGYASGHPRPDELLLVIEVAGTSLAYDLRRKVPRYALAGIPEAWVVDISADRIEVFRGPTANGYSENQRADRGEEVSSAAFPDLVLDVAEILGL